MTFLPAPTPRDDDQALAEVNAAYGACGHPRQNDLAGRLLPCAAPWCGLAGDEIRVPWHRQEYAAGGLWKGAGRVEVRAVEIVYRREQVTTTRGLKFIWRRTP